MSIIQLGGLQSTFIPQPRDETSARSDAGSRSKPDAQPNGASAATQSPTQSAVQTQDVAPIAAPEAAGASDSSAPSRPNAESVVSARVVASEAAEIEARVASAEQELLRARAAANAYREAQTVLRPNSDEPLTATQSVTPENDPFNNDNIPSGAARA